MFPTYVMLLRLTNFLMVNVSLIIKKIIGIDHAYISWMLATSAFLNSG